MSYGLIYGEGRHRHRGTWKFGPVRAILLASVGCWAIPRRNDRVGCRTVIHPQEVIARSWKLVKHAHGGVAHGSNMPFVRQGRQHLLRGCHFQSDSLQ